MNTTPQRGQRNADRTQAHVSGEPARDAEHETPHETPRIRTRQRHSSAVTNPFDIPQAEIPPDLSYEWKRYSVSGLSADHDPFYLASMREQGWEPVPPSRHPNRVPPDYDKPYILKDGLILMDRPKELTREARAEVQQFSRQQVREAEQRLGMTPKDTMTRQHEGIQPRVVKEVGRMVAIED